MSVTFRVIGRGVFDHFVARASEWGLACCLFCFGWRLLLPSDTFDSAHGYVVMARLASESAWGWSITLLGAARLASLFVNGTFKSIARWTPIVRAVAAFLSVFVWLAIGMSMFLANPAGVYFIAYAGFVFGDGLNTYLAAADSGTSERRRRIYARSG